jgi:hypothetical protein
MSDLHLPLNCFFWISMFSRGKSPNCRGFTSNNHPKRILSLMKRSWTTRWTAWSVFIIQRLHCVLDEPFPCNSFRGIPSNICRARSPVPGNRFPSYAAFRRTSAARGTELELGVDMDGWQASRWASRCAGWAVWNRERGERESALSAHRGARGPIGMKMVWKTSKSFPFFWPVRRKKWKSE